MLSGLAECLAGCRRESGIVSSVEHPSFFRRSAGPGWALVGDAGHFKDPVTAQGIRDAVRFGRLLGEAAADALDRGPAELDAAVRAWERRRNRECLETYFWTYGLARDDALHPVKIEILRLLSGEEQGSRRLLDVYSRHLRPSQVLTPGLLLRGTAKAMRQEDTSVWDALKAAGFETRLEAKARLGRVRFRL